MAYLFAVYPGVNPASPLLLQVGLKGGFYFFVFVLAVNPTDFYHIFIPVRQSEKGLFLPLSFFLRAGLNGRFCVGLKSGFYFSSL